MQLRRSRLTNALRAAVDPSKCVVATRRERGISVNGQVPSRSRHLSGRAQMAAESWHQSPRPPPLLFELEKLRVAWRALRDVLPRVILRQFLTKGDLTNRRLLRATHPVRVGIVREDRFLDLLSETFVFLSRCLCHRSLPLWQLGIDCACSAAPADACLT